LQAEVLRSCVTLNVSEATNLRRFGAEHRSSAERVEDEGEFFEPFVDDDKDGFLGVLLDI